MSEQEFDYYYITYICGGREKASVIGFANEVCKKKLTPADIMEFQITVEKGQDIFIRNIFYMGTYTKEHQREVIKKRREMHNNRVLFDHQRIN